MKKLIPPLALSIAVSSFLLFAIVPQKWELQNRDDFLKGKFDGISVSSEGRLFLAPQEAEIDAPSEEFFLSLLVTDDEVLYLGTGHGGKIYRIDKDRKAELYFSVPEMDVTCLARDRRGALYAGTSPNGRVYKITEKGKGEEFFNPSEKYIWDLLFVEPGELRVAVGESGGIYAVSPQGVGKVVFKAEENHILCLKSSSRGDIIAGSGGNGLVYRISSGGSASVLFETPYEEVRSIAIARDGTIFAAASGIPVPREKEDVPPVKTGASAGVTVTVSAAVPDVPVSPVSEQKGTGALFKINKEGIARKVWSSPEEMIYSLLLEGEEERVLFGTGNKGRIYALEPTDRVSLLLQQPSEQVYNLVLHGSHIYVLSNNPCYLGRLLPEQRFSGEYLSSILDAKTVSAWGRIVWDAAAGAGMTSLQVQTRSGNTSDPNATWSPWSPPYQKFEEQILSPKARYLQFKVLFRTQRGNLTPVLNKLTLFYLQTNLAPSITRLELLKPNEVYFKLPEQEDVIMGAEKHLPDPPAKREETRISFPARKGERKGFQTITWEAADENGDTLRYSLAMRKDGEEEWRVLEESWTESLYAFDTLSFPDGMYLLKLTASDSPSNPLGNELSTEKISQPFVIDNSLPVIRNFEAVRNGNRLDVAFLAEDAFSYIEEVKYLVRPGEWRVVFPADGIADSKLESFQFAVRVPAGSGGLITIRVKDSYGNVGVHRQEFEFPVAPRESGGGPEG